MSVEEKVKEIIVDQLGVDEKQVTDQRENHSRRGEPDHRLHTVISKQITISRQNEYKGPVREV